MTLAPLVALALCSTPALAQEAKQNPCHHGEVACEGAPPSEAPEATIVRGEKPKGLKAVSLSELLKTPQAHDGKAIALHAKVRKACSRKGCWMELADQEKGPGVRVTFKDYGFFVPLDSAGRRAKVEGTVKVTELSEETAKHYESEGAQVPRGKDGKPREVQLVATAVELAPAKTAAK